MSQLISFLRYLAIGSTALDEDALDEDHVAVTAFPSGFLPFIHQRIWIVFSSKFRRISSHYTDFAILCIKAWIEQVQ